MGLGLVVVFAVALPKIESDESISLPATLPGGWTSVELVGSASDDPQQPEGYADQQQQALDYVRDGLDDVYDVPTTFRAYTTQEQDAFLTVSVIGAPGGAFTPDGFADPELVGLERAPVELIRDGDAVCVVNWQSASPDEPPLHVSCQLSQDGRTIQVGVSTVSVEDAVDLIHDVADSLR